MTIKEIYAKYEIPPNLQLHMLRVAAFSGLIADNWKGPELINKETIVNACLLHDLGNIIKFDFDNFPQLLGNEIVNIVHWKDVKRKMIERYGTDEDTATVEMVKEIGVLEEVMFIVRNWGFKNFTKIDESDNWNWKIAVYADHRISPTGIVSLRQNLENKQKRYKLSRPNASHVSSEAEDLFESAVNIEDGIAVRINHNLQVITNVDIEAKSLIDFQFNTGL